jgi:hypothetical protein
MPREEPTLIRRPFLALLDTVKVVWCTKACFASSCHSPIKSQHAEAVAVGLKLRMKGSVRCCLDDLGNCFIRFLARSLPANRSNRGVDGEQGLTYKERHVLKRTLLILSITSRICRERAKIRSWPVFEYAVMMDLRLILWALTRCERQLD